MSMTNRFFVALAARRRKTSIARLLTSAEHRVEQQAGFTPLLILPAEAPIPHPIARGNAAGVHRHAERYASRDLGWRLKVI
jgi:hypothetical protein